MVVITDEKNQYINLGIIALIEKSIPGYDTVQFQCLNALTFSAVQHADVIIKRLLPGENRYCNTLLCQWRHQKMIIWLCNDDRTFPIHETTNLNSLTVCLNLMNPVSSLFSTIRLKLEWFYNRAYRTPPVQICVGCQMQRLTPQQFTVGFGLFHGLSIKDIASISGLSEKVIYSHKYSLMTRFDLRNLNELRVFLALVKDTL